MPHIVSTRSSMCCVCMEAVLQYATMLRFLAANEHHIDTYLAGLPLSLARVVAQYGRVNSWCQCCRRNTAVFRPDDEPDEPDVPFSKLGVMPSSTMHSRTGACLHVRCSGITQRHTL